jgi:hypothetical protein
MGVNEDAESILTDSIEETRFREEAFKRYQILYDKKQALLTPYRKACKLEKWKEAHDLLDEIYETHLAMLQALDDSR